jgi:hypothetical protein
LFEGRHVVADCFLRLRSGFMDGFPHLLEEELYVWGESCDVFVDVFEIGWLPDGYHF